MRLTARAIRDFCLLTCREDSASGLIDAERELEQVVVTAHLVRRQNNGLDLYRARGTNDWRGRPRYRLLVGDGAVVRVLAQSSNRGQRGT